MMSKISLCRSAMIASVVGASTTDTVADGNG